MTDSCIFCEIVAGRAACARVYEDDQVLAFMDLFPWSPGHTLVIPKIHAQHLHELDDALNQHLLSVVNRIRRAIPQTDIACQGANIFINDGVAANQHVPHVHWHVLPRARGDGRKVLWAMASRVANYFGKADRRGRLQAHADAIASVLATGD